MKSHTKILFSYLKYVNVYSVNPLYLIFSKMNKYIKEINRNKYLRLVPTNESKEKIFRTVV